MEGRRDRRIADFLKKGPMRWGNDQAQAQWKAHQEVSGRYRLERLKVRRLALELLPVSEGTVPNDCCEYCRRPGGLSHADLGSLRTDRRNPQTHGTCVDKRLRDMQRTVDRCEGDFATLARLQHAHDIPPDVVKLILWRLLALRGVRWDLPGA